MNITIDTAQNIGKRNEQQDAFGTSTALSGEFTDHGGVLAVVADGMGGLQGGALASLAAVKTFIESYAGKERSEDIETALKRSIVAANDAVHTTAEENGFGDNCGTTLIAAVLHESGIYWVYAGDSRIYLTDGKALQQLTEDQIYARRLMQAAEKGLVDKELAKTHPQREALTSYLGDKTIDEIGFGALKGSVPKGVTLLLCTDGLYKFLEEGSILEICSKNRLTPAKELIAAALAKGHRSQDNITAVTMYNEKPADSVKTQEIPETQEIRLLTTAKHSAFPETCFPGRQ